MTYFCAQGEGKYGEYKQGGGKPRPYYITGKTGISCIM
jgi:hypothetical protein